jgi:glycosyltransferase involved in cell wall biosynthesis
MSVVVPLYNESANVKPLVERICAALCKAPGAVEIILVDDGSTDDTWAQILEQAKLHSEVRGIRHKRNAGQSAGLYTGFRAARAPVVATLDGDLQNDPADLPEMAAYLKEADMVCGVRAKRADNWVRRRSSAIARFFRGAMLRANFSDTGCNLRIFKRDLIPYLPPFDGLHRFMPYFVHNIGKTVKQLPVRHHPRVAGVSKYGVWNRLGRGIRDLIMVRWYLQRQIGSIPTETTGER